MRTVILSFALALTALTCAVAACRGPAAADAPAKAAGENPSGGAEDPFASIPRVKVGELASALREGRAVALDVRPAEAFEAEHIEGAVNIPEEEVVARAAELPKDKLVVAYCA